MNSHFNLLAPFYDRVIPFERLDQMLRILGLPHADSLLDAGGGTGRVAAALRPYPELYHKTPNGDEVYKVSIVYLSRDWSGEIRLNDEHTEWKWFQADKIPEELSPPIKPTIKQFKSFSKSDRFRNS